MKTIKVVVLECKRCGYEWTPRINAKDVKMCPACKSRLFREPRK
jgi:predicted Zn-ribbon and HTH transcriptional regulator